MKDKTPDQVFQGRTIGYLEYANDWTWRGSGYDEGWERPTIEELVAIRDVLTDWLQSQGMW